MGRRGLQATQADPASWRLCCFGWCKELHFYRACVNGAHLRISAASVRKCHQSKRGWQVHRKFRLTSRNKQQVRHRGRSSSLASKLASTPHMGNSLPQCKALQVSLLAKRRKRWPGGHTRSALTKRQEPRARGREENSWLWARKRGVAKDYKSACGFKCLPPARRYRQVGRQKKVKMGGPLAWKTAG